MQKYKITEFQESNNGDYGVWRMKIDEVEVQVFAPYMSDDGKVLWTVIWDGAEDFYGNKKNMLKRYPELRDIIY